MDMWRNGYIIIAYWNFLICGIIVAQISWVEVCTSIPLFCFSLDKASLRIVDGWVIRDLINLIAIIDMFIISLICNRHIYIINLVDPKHIYFFVSG